ncbi:MAG: 50S ribosomal protein L18e [Desulfurococcaceae archaeon]|uniref:Large ribosomal subunit protein eL18 n=1 Tax=Staphylothermus marinus TaxID=2280 RepID=A0A7C4H565_STAMA
MKKTGPTNIVLRKTIRLLVKYSREYKAPIWRAIARELEKPARKRRVVNISRINRHTSAGDIVIVPGKVLGSGDLKHSVTVAAISFSKKALEKINKAGGRAIYITDLVKLNPSGSNVKIIG